MKVQSCASYSRCMIIFSFGKQNYQKGKAVNLLDMRQGPGLKNGQEADLKVCQESDLTMGAEMICGESDLGQILVGQHWFDKSIILYVAPLSPFSFSDTFSQ
jgi:hypothetical protein